MLGFDKNRPGSFLLDTLMPARGSLPTAPGSAASPCELVFQTDNDSTLGRSHIIPALGWQLDRPVLPCHSGNLLSLYEAGHPATQARLLPTNTLWGSPGRELWAPASPTRHARTRIGSGTSRGRSSVSVAPPASPAPSDGLALLLAVLPKIFISIGHLPRRSRLLGGPE